MVTGNPSNTIPVIPEGVPKGDLLKRHVVSHLQH